MEGQLRHREAVFLPKLVNLHQVNEVPDLLLHSGQANVAVQLLLQVLQLLRRGGFLLGPGGSACGLRGFRGVRFLLGGCRGRPTRLLRRFGLRCGGRAPEVRPHAAEVVLRQGLDDLQLLEDDFVFFVLLVHSRQPFMRLVERSP